MWHKVSLNWDENELKASFPSRLVDIPGQKNPLWPNYLLIKCKVKHKKPHPEFEFSSIPYPTTIPVYAKLSISIEVPSEKLVC